MAWKNRFGMFIHWGVYAVPQLHEQAFARYDLPRAVYESLYRQFDPVNFDPEAWVLLAKNAGMRYICFTAKHHDGFCMWNTRYTDYNIMQTPYGKDVLKQLSDACQKHGMALSLYYSNPDWHHPHAFNPASSHQWRAVDRETGDFAVYKTYIKNQITELMTNYGHIYTLFWDIPPGLEDPSINALVRSLQPGILINDRGFDTGDFSTPEREFDRQSRPPRYTRRTESCNSIDVNSWGYRADSEFYSYRYLMASICKTMARGGSFLLNVGPMADGSLDPAHAERIRRIGRWYTQMEGCLEDHETDAFAYQLRPDNDYIALKKNGKTYFCFFDGLLSNAVSIANAPGLPRAVRLMNRDQALPFRKMVLPGPNDPVTGVAQTEYLCIREIPADELAEEPIILEVTW